MGVYFPLIIFQLPQLSLCCLCQSTWWDRLPADWESLTTSSYWKVPVRGISQLTWMQMSGQRTGCKKRPRRLMIPIISCREGKKGRGRERRVCWVIHTLALSFPGSPPSCFVCLLNPLITKSFLVQCWWILGLPNPRVGHYVCLARSVLANIHRDANQVFGSLAGASFVYCWRFAVLEEDLSVWIWELCFEGFLASLKAR